MMTYREETLENADRGMTSTNLSSVSNFNAALTADIAAISQIDAVASILEIVCRTTGMGFAAVARVTRDRWVACAVRDEIAFGLLPGGELDVKTTICDEIRDSGRAVVIDHVAEDKDFCNHHTPRMYGLQSYISMPIILPDGAFFGTLCAIDPRPARLNRPEVIGMFKNFAQLIAFHLDAQARAAKQDAALLDAQEAANLREQFVAILAHDLRNPLASIDAGVNVILRRKPDEKTRSIGEQIHKSARRMAALIDDILDFARGRLGGGFMLERNPNAPLFEQLEQVIGELRDVSESPIEARINLTHPVNCDPKRVAQIASNLVANAVKHGAPSKPIRVWASTNEKGFELAVANEGDPIDEIVAQQLFQPLFRGNGGSSSNQGLGLGLYIASEIARAHGGKIEDASSKKETRLTLHIPA